MISKLWGLCIECKAEKFKKPIRFCESQSMTKPDITNPKAASPTEKRDFPGKLFASSFSHRK